MSTLPIKIFNLGSSNQLFAKSLVLHMISVFLFENKQKYSNLMKNEILEAKKIVQLPP